MDSFDFVFEVMIALVGIATCFLINALSFAAMIVALRGMDREQRLSAGRGGRLSDHPIIEPGLGQHHAVHDGCGQEAAFAQRYGPVDIGGGFRGFGHEVLTRHARHGEMPYSSPTITDTATVFTIV